MREEGRAPARDPLYEQEMPVVRERDDARAIAGELVRRTGLSLTPQRWAVLKALVQGPRHVTAEEVYERAGHRAARATVYRSLRALVRAGLVRRLTPDEGPSRYELASPASSTAHAICRKCGKVVEIEGAEPASLMKGLAKIEEFEVSDCELRLHGLCAECLHR